MADLCLAIPFLDDLDDMVLDLVLAYLPSPLDANLRVTCKRMHQHIDAPKRRSIDKMLKRGAKLGSRDLWDLAIAKVSRDSKVNFERALFFAAKYCCLDLCLLAICQCSLDLQHAIIAMADGAAEGGWRNLCLLAREFTVRYVKVRDLEKLTHCQNLSVESAIKALDSAGLVPQFYGISIFECIMEGAARGCHADLCEFAYNSIMKADGLERSCLYWLMRGVTKSNPKSPHICDIIDLIQKMSKDPEKSASDLVDIAIATGRIDICEMMFVRGYSTPQQIFNTGLLYRQTDACKWALAHGARSDIRNMYDCLELVSIDSFARVSAEIYHRKESDERAGFAHSIITYLRFVIDLCADSPYRSKVETVLATFVHLCSIPDH